MRKGVLYAFILVVAMLAAMGIVILSSAGDVNSMRLHGDPYHFMKNQLKFLGAGIFLATCAAAFNYRRWREHWLLTIVFCVAVFALLVGVFGFRAINGSHRWIPIGPLNLQPSELAKLATVIGIAVYLDRIGWRVELFTRGALAGSIILALMAGPVCLEPDFGSTMVIALVGFLVMFTSGVRFWHMMPIGGAGLVAVGAMILSNANRMARILEFMGSNATSVGAGAAVTQSAKIAAEYQAKMALVAISRGGLWGVGLGESMQKQAYLPEAHTDFIFAVGAEELGFFFSLAVVLLFFAFFVLSLRIARAARDKLGRSLVMGMSFIIFFQAAFNLGVVCKALPTKGMALPFFSYGGTNLVCTFIAVGTILSVGIRSLKSNDIRKGRRRAPREALSDKQTSYETSEYEDGMEET